MNFNSTTPSLLKYVSLHSNCICKSVFMLECLFWQDWVNMDLGHEKLSSAYNNLPELLWNLRIMSCKSQNYFKWYVFTPYSQLHNDTETRRDLLQVWKETFKAFNGGVLLSFSTLSFSPENFHENSAISRLAWQPLTNLHHDCTSFSPFLAFTSEAWQSSVLNGTSLES